MAAHNAHALVLPFPAQGHINPMLQFSKRLVSKGIKTTLVNSVYISNIMHANIAHTSINFETISDGFDKGGLDEAGTEVYMDVFAKVGSKNLTDLIKKLESSGNPINALIYDSFLPWALDVAKEFGVIGAAFSTQTCAVNDVYYHVFKGLLSVPLPPEDSSVNLPGLPELQPTELPSFIYKYGSYPGFTDMVLKQFSNIDGADWLLCNIFYELEEDVLNKWMKKHWRVLTVGPTVPSMFLDKRLEDDTDYGLNIFKPDSSLCINWLNKQPKQSVVYVSMGSWSQLEAGQTDEIAAALRNVSGFNFLWVVRENEREKLPENFIEETSEKGLVVAWSPQLEVLAHESTGCFVTHCGLSSVLESLSLGVPVVAMPLWTDQTTNAKFVEDVWGVGLRTRRNEKGIVTRESLEYCLKEILDGEKGKEIKKNAAKWEKLAKGAVNEGGSSDKNIDAFVDDLVRSSITSRSY
nr:UDP-glucose dependent glucosyltransferase [Gentiana hybrid cultivar]